MRKLSSKNQKIQRNIKSVFNKKLERQGNVCTFCGKYHFGFDPVHIIRRSYSVKLQDDERNIIVGGRMCHQQFDDIGFILLFKLYPRRCKAILERMRLLDREYFNRFISRHGIPEW